MTWPDPKLDLLDWRRRVAGLYAAVRAERDPAAGHEVWRTGRDAILREHPQSPLKPDDRMRWSGIPVWPYDPELRWELPVDPVPEAELRLVHSANDGEIRMRLIGRVAVPDPVDATLDVWWLEQYGGGLFLPLKDGTAGRSSYGAGRYLLDSAKGADLRRPLPGPGQRPVGDVVGFLLDSAKGADLGGSVGRLILDFNFAYHPSCRYDDKWQCPLAPPGNTVAYPIEAGERLS